MASRNRAAGHDVTAVRMEEATQSIDTNTETQPACPVDVSSLPSLEIRMPMDRGTAASERPF